MASRFGGRRSLGLAVLLVGALLACKKKAPVPSPAPTATVDPDIEKTKKLQPEVKQFFTQLAAIDKKAKAEPRVRADKPFKEKLEKARYIILGDRWLADSHHEAGADELELDNTVYSLCAYGLDKPILKPDDQKYADECLAWQYVAVVRPRSLTLPKVNMGTKTFAPGSFIGDMLLFEVKTAEIKGRYQMSITNSDKLTYLENSTDEEWQKKAKDDLAENVTGVIDERMALERQSMAR